jgi:isoleucyl-tRNA synthetase
VVAPQEVISRHGGEILRLWVAATDFREDVRISPQILSQLIEAYRKIRNTCRFLLGNLYDYDPERDRVEDESMEEIDRLLLHRLQKLILRIRKAYEDFDFHLVFHSLNQFCAVDLSALYLDVIKDRLYSEKAGSPLRRAAQRVLRECLVELTRLMAPVLSFTAEEVWQHIPRETLPPALREASSVHLSRFPESQPADVDESLAARWEQLLRVRAEVARVLEGLRVQKRIGSSLDAKVTLYAKEALYPFLQSQIKSLAPLFIVSAVELKSWDGDRLPETTVGADLKDLAVAGATAEGKRCARCWRYLDSVGRDHQHPDLCGRCADAVRG